MKKGETLKVVNFNLTERLENYMSTLTMEDGDGKWEGTKVFKNPNGKVIMVLNTLLGNKSYILTHWMLYIRIKDVIDNVLGNYRFIKDVVFENKFEVERIKFIEGSSAWISQFLIEDYFKRKYKLSVHGCSKSSDYDFDFVTPQLFEYIRNNINKNKTINRMRLNNFMLGLKYKNGDLIEQTSYVIKEKKIFNIKNNIKYHGVFVDDVKEFTLCEMVK